MQQLPSLEWSGRPRTNGYKPAKTTLPQLQTLVVHLLSLIVGSLALDLGNTSSLPGALFVVPGTLFSHRRRQYADNLCRSVGTSEV